MNNSLILAGLFLLLNLPLAYEITNNLFRGIVSTSNTGCLNITGHLTHSIIFFIFTLALMSLTNIFTDSFKRLTVWDMVKYTFCTTLLFYILSDKDTYKLIAERVDPKYAVDGCPTNSGVLVHTAIFFGIKHLMSL